MLSLEAEVKALIEALHTPMVNEERWEIAREFLKRAWIDGYHERLLKRKCKHCSYPSREKEGK